jgi:hypothetical protein
MTRCCATHASLRPGCWSLPSWRAAGAPPRRAIRPPRRQQRLHRLRAGSRRAARRHPSCRGPGSSSPRVSRRACCSSSPSGTTGFRLASRTETSRSRATRSPSTTRRSAASWFPTESGAAGGPSRATRCGSSQSEKSPAAAAPTSSRTRPTTRRLLAKPARPRRRWSDLAPEARASAAPARQSRCRPRRPPRS